MRRTPFLTAAGFLLLGVFCVAPRAARADAVEDLAKVLDAVGSFKGIPVTGADIRASRDLFGCLDKAANDKAIAECLDTFNSSPVGQKAFGLPSWFHTLILVYIDIREGDFLALVGHTTYAIACAIANVVFAVDVCGIAQVILETLGAAKEALSDIVGFIKDVGGTIADFLGLGGSDGPPLWQVIFNDYVKPNIGQYAEDWLERPKTFKAEFDVTGHEAKSLVCTISQKKFGKACAWLFGTGNTAQEVAFVPLFRGDTIKAIQMGEVAAVTQAVATVGKRGAEWVQFRHDWLAGRGPQDRFRKAYGVWGPAVIKVNCNAAAGPWKQFLDYVNQPEVKPEAAKVLNKLSGWSFQTAAQFCDSYDAGLSTKKLDGCAVVGVASEKGLKLDCAPGTSFSACQSADKTVGSTKFPPPFDLQCTTHALKMSDQKTGAIGQKPPNLAPTPVKPVGMPEGPSPK